MGLTYFMLTVNSDLTGLMPRLILHLTGFTCYFVGIDMLGSYHFAIISNLAVLLTVA